MRILLISLIFLNLFCSLCSSVIAKSTECNISSERVFKDICTNAVSLFDKAPEYHCDSISFTFHPPQLVVMDPNDTMIYVVSTDPDPEIAAAGIFLRMLNSMTVAFDGSYMDYNTTYYIIVLLGPRDGNGGINFHKPCIQSDGPKLFMFLRAPEPDAGSDDVVCGTIYDLKGIQSVNYSNLKWRSVTGKGVSFTDDASALTTVNTNGQYGTYVFELTEDNHNCIVSDRVSITFNQAPIMSVDQNICIDKNDNTYPYQAILKITNGLPPYTLLKGDGIINDNKYYTDTLSSLSNYTVQIQDANHCISNLVIDTYNCNCGTLNTGNHDSIAGRNFRQIGLIAKLNSLATQSGSWKLISGPGSVLFEKVNNPKSKVRVDKYGMYCFQWSFDNFDLNCLYKDTVCVLFYNQKTRKLNFQKNPIEDRSMISSQEEHDLPEIYTPTLVSSDNIRKDSCTNAVSLFDRTLEFHCDSISFTFHPPQLIVMDPNDTMIYVVSFDPDPSVAASGPVGFINILPSQTVTYDPSYMNLLSTYYIVVLLGPKDGKGSIDFNKPCVQFDGPKPFVFYPCSGCELINAGKLDSNLTLLCSDKCEIIRSIIPETLDSGDVVIYILHQSSYNDKVIPRIDTFYSINDLICFDSTKMVPGKTYYITRVVGNRLNNTNLVDPTDPCIRASNNQPIIWYSYPQSNAGRDFKQHGLIAKLNAVSAQFGYSYWRQISGPGKSIFENFENPKSRVRINSYGTYCFAWAINQFGCVSEDTMCVSFYNLKTRKINFQNNHLEDRNIFSNDEESDLAEVTTPTLISNAGHIFISLNAELNYPITFNWYDNIGRIILKEKIDVNPGASDIQIKSPQKAGFYYLLIENQDASFVEKICVSQ